jgi:hypothetical protein
LASCLAMKISGCLQAIERGGLEPPHLVVGKAPA